MSRRIDIELTSARPDGTWTWRAAGAKQPKGELDGSLLPEGAGVGAVLKVEAEFLVDGIEITGVVPGKGPRKEAQRLEVLGSGKEEPLVTTQLAPKGRGRGKGRRRDGDGPGPRGAGRGGPRRGEGERGPRPDPVPQRPAPKRLRPRRAHRDAALAEIPEEQRPIAELVLQGGVPAVREEARKQNEAAKKENRPGIPVDQVVTMAEAQLPKLRAAEWLDRAEAAKADLEELDLRDLRSVVVAAESGARDDAARALRDELAAGLARRVEEEHRLWISDMEANLDAGRFVRALRLSSRPPKAGTPLPPELSARMVADVSRGLDAGTKQELYAAALDALSFSPVRTQVVPAGRPAEPGEELLEAARRVADKAPAIAELFGVNPSESGAARKRRTRAPRGNRSKGPGADRPKGPGAGRPKGDGGSDRGGDRPKGDSGGGRAKADTAEDQPTADTASTTAEDQPTADTASTTAEDQPTGDTASTTAEDQPTGDTASATAGDQPTGDGASASAGGEGPPSAEAEQGEQG